MFLQDLSLSDAKYILGQYVSIPSPCKWKGLCGLNCQCRGVSIFFDQLSGARSIQKLIEIHSTRVYFKYFKASLIEFKSDSN